MLSCREVTEKSSALVDGELGLRSRFAICLHLLMCVNCRRFIRQFRRLAQALSLRQEGDPVSDDFVDRIMTRVDSAAADEAPPAAPIRDPE